MEPDMRAQWEHECLGCGAVLVGLEICACQQQCAFPGECCMPGFHTRDECHTAEMLEALEAMEEGWEEEG